MKGSCKSLPERAFVRWCLRQISTNQFHYRELSGQVKSDVRKKLWNEQNGMCVYCGRVIQPDERDRLGQPTVHIEHFRPQSQYRVLELCHANLFLSCGPSGIQGETCGNRKDNWFDETRNIYPNRHDILDRFKCKLNGELVARSPGDLAAKEMIDQLDLNHVELSTGRKAIFKKIDEEELEIEDFLDVNNIARRDYAHIAAEYLGLSILPVLSKS